MIIESWSGIGWVTREDGTIEGIIVATDGSTTNLDGENPVLHRGDTIYLEGFATVAEGRVSASDSSPSAT